MSETQWTPGQLDEVTKLTRDYAAYSRDAAGLGDVLGGLLFFLTASFWVDYRFLPTRILVILTPLLWIAAKEWLQRRYYQAEGRVEQAVTVGNRIVFWVFTVFSVLLSVTVALFLATSVTGNAPEAYVRAGVALLILLAIPAVIGRYLRGHSEYFVGMCLMLHAARAVYGLRIFTRPGMEVPGPEVLGPGSIRAAAFVGGLLGTVETLAALCAFVLILEGLRQHFAFRKLRVQLASLRGQL